MVCPVDGAGKRAGKDGKGAPVLAGVKMTRILVHFWNQFTSPESRSRTSRGLPDSLALRTVDAVPPFFLLGHHAATIRSQSASIASLRTW